MRALLVREATGSPLPSSVLETIDGLVDPQPRTPEVLLAMLVDSDASVARYAAARLGQRPAGVAALAHCAEFNAAEAERCAGGLAASNAATAEVHHALTHPDAGVRARMLGALAQAPSAPTLEELEGLETDPVPDVRAAVATALGRVGPGAVPRLSALLEDHEPSVRTAAAAELMRLLPPEKLDPLVT